MIFLFINPPPISTHQRWLVSQVSHCQMKRVLISIVVVYASGCVFADGPTSAPDIDSAEFMRRMDELNKHAATQPAHGQVIAPQAQSNAPQKFHLTDDAPIEIRVWFESVTTDEGRRQTVMSMQSDVRDRESAIAEDKQKLKEIRRRDIKQIAGGGAIIGTGRHMTKNDPDDVLAQRAEVRQQQDLIDQEERDLIEVRRQLNDVRYSKNVTPTPPPLTSFTPGTFGHARAVALIKQIASGNEARVSIDGTEYWLSGFDLSKQADGDSVNFSGDVIVSTKTYDTVLGAPRTIISISSVDLKKFLVAE